MIQWWSSDSRERVIETTPRLEDESRKESFKPRMVPSGGKKLLVDLFLGLHMQSRLVTKDRKAHAKK